VRFSAAQLEHFRRLSHDRNPLHADAAYARRTPFGQPVVFGVCGVLAALGAWAAGRRFRLRALTADFRKPLFPDRDYRLQLTEQNGTVTARYWDGGTLQAKISFEPLPADREWPVPEPGQTAPPPRTEANRPAKEGFAVGPARYWPEFSALREMGRNLGLEATQLPFSQLSALLWSSYVVGMEYPGRQALYSELRLRFTDDASAGPLELSSTAGSFDERINEARLEARGAGIETLTIRAFWRPEPLQWSARDAEAALGGSGPSFAGKSALVTGASRGFGAALGLALSLRGARTLFNGRQAPSDAGVSWLQELGGSAIWVPGDVAREDACREIAETVARETPGLDYLVLNAFPVIHAQPFLEQPPGALEQYVASSLALSTRLLHALAPRLRPAARVVAISSLYARTPAPGYAHYAAAKGAAEGLLRALAAELRGIHFVIARPPRMLTDQTNAAFDLHPPEQAHAVAARLLARLGELPDTPPAPGANLHEIDL
jgi:NAD(P)-dependent dehydrogenase (short-subunit alcohol dehydrogenase family)